MQVNSSTTSATSQTGGVHGGHHHGGMRGQGLTDLAGALGMNESDLKQQLSSGKSVADIAKDNGVSLDQVKDAMKTAMQQRLSQDLQSGKLTQQQFDNISQRQAGFLDRFLQQAGRGAAGPEGTAKAGA